jgi:RNA polymerase sigma-70 factor (ECF subfamily)
VSSRPDATLPGTDDTENDRALMARVQAGDERAFGVLMTRWELPVKAVIARLVLNVSEAEDLAQETFVRVWQQRARFRAEAEFRPWLFAIAVNLARNRLRWWRRRPLVSLEAWSGGDSEPAVPRELAHPGPSAAAHVDRAEAAAAVRDAVAILPPALREALVLFEYEHLSHAEIAAIVGATAKAVETRIYRARERLRPALHDWR